MDILVVSDIHNDVENLMNFIDKICLLKFDVIIAVGDFTDVNLPKGFRDVDIGELIIEELNTFKKPILAVPGNFDKNLIELFEKKDISLHGRGKKIENVGFYGFGGARTPYNTPLEPREEEIEEGLTKAYEEIKKCEFRVQVTHMPPARTKLDVLFTGAHVGSEVIRNFIEKMQPTVAISAHIHEARGLDELGKTKLINSGRFPEGYCGLITLEKGNVNTKIVNLI
jgi:Icc-related predicted phosphoesterase